MAIQSVRAQLNGTWHTLTYDSASGMYTATVTAPGATSYNQPNGYYNITVEATNTAGTSITTSGAALDALRLQVKEKVPPVITITSPGAGAFVGNNQHPVAFTLSDETGGSGINIGSLVVKQDGTQVSSSALSVSSVSGGYTVIYTPEAPLPDGSHTVTIDVSDNDGNAATQKTVTYNIDTVPPTLDVTNPLDGVITADSLVVVSGKTNDATSSNVTVKITLNNVDQGAVAINASGLFNKTLTLAEGDNVIVVTATDAAGQTSSVRRLVVLDTSVPVIVSATVTPNPADTAASVIISVEVKG